MRLVYLLVAALILGCTSHLSIEPDRAAINSSVEQLLLEGVEGEASVRYNPDNPARNDSYTISYDDCVDGLCRLFVEMRVYWISNYDKVLDIELYFMYNGTLVNQTVVEERTVMR